MTDETAAVPNIGDGASWRTVKTVERLDAMDRSRLIERVQGYVDHAAIAAAREVYEVAQRDTAAMVGQGEPAAIERARAAEQGAREAFMRATGAAHERVYLHGKQLADEATAEAAAAHDALAAASGKLTYATAVRHFASSMGFRYAEQVERGAYVPEQAA